MNMDQRDSQHKINITEPYNTTSDTYSSPSRKHRRSIMSVQWHIGILVSGNNILAKEMFY